jgi:hypothetical protein
MLIPVNRYESPSRQRAVPQRVTYPDVCDGAGIAVGVGATDAAITEGVVVAVELGLAVDGAFTISLGDWVGLGAIAGGLVDGSGAVVGVGPVVEMRDGEAEGPFVVVKMKTLDASTAPI